MRMRSHARDSRSQNFQYYFDSHSIAWVLKITLFSFTFWRPAPPKFRTVSKSFFIYIFQAFQWMPIRMAMSCMAACKLFPKGYLNLCFHLLF